MKVISMPVARSVSLSSKFNLYAALLAVAVLLSIAQDFLFSYFQNTGFYLSESLLYNSIWLFFIPVALLEVRLLKSFQIESKVVRILRQLGISIVFSLMHVLIFASAFTLISYLVFSPPHRFELIFYGAISNQLFLIFLFYTFFPYLSALLKPKSRPNETVNTSLQVKRDSGFINIETSSILLISTDKPYSAIITESQKYLDDRSLKELESLLAHETFKRVHRSSIINLQMVTELKSRKNGDYDALLKNGQTVRLSRHLRDNWISLIH